MTRTNALYALAAFALGATTVLVAKTKVTFDPKAYYVAATPKAAAAALLKEAEVLAKDDTWQRVGIGRVYCQSGDCARGEALFQSVLGGKAEKSDIYHQLGGVVPGSRALLASVEPTAPRKTRGAG